MRAPHGERLQKPQSIGHLLEHRSTNFALPIADVKFAKENNRVVDFQLGDIGNVPSTDLRRQSLSAKPLALACFALTVTAPAI